MHLKKFVVSFLAVIFSGIAWKFFAVLAGSTQSFQANAGNLLVFILSAALAYAFLFITVLSNDRLDFFVTSLISSLWLPVFLGTSAAVLISALVLFVVTQIIMEFPGALKKSVDLKYFSTAYMKIALVVLVLIGISAGYVQKHLTRSVTEKTISTRTSNYLWPFVKQYVSQFDSEQTVDQFIAEQFRQQGFASPDTAVIAAQRRELAEQFGVELRGGEKMSDVGKTFLADRFGELLKQFNFERTSIYIIFLSLLILWPFGRFFFALVALIVYNLFLAAGLLKITETPVIAKHLEF